MDIVRYVCGIYVVSRHVCKYTMEGDPMTRLSKESASGRGDSYDQREISVLQNITFAGRLIVAFHHFGN